MAQEHVARCGDCCDVIGLRLQRSRYTLGDGLEQVARYARRLDRDTGYLIIFEPTSSTPFEDRGEVEEIGHDDINVIVVRS